MGFAFLTFCNATLESGIKIVLEETNLRQYVQNADIVITACRDARDAIRLTPERRYVIKRGRVVASTTVQSKLAIF